MENILDDNNIADPPVAKAPKKPKTKKSAPIDLLDRNFLNPIWLSISECAKLGGVKTKTIRRAIQSKNLKYKINGTKYYVEMSSLIIYLYSKTKLTNKLNQNGIGQYIEKWKK